MVNKNELVGLLQKYGFTEEQINYALEKVGY